MKRRIRSFFPLCLIAVSLLAAVSCETGDDSDDAFGYLFINASDYVLTVQPNGQSSWSAFTLAAGGSKTVSIPEGTIYFKYNYADYIKCDTSSAGRIRFYNRTLLGIKNSTTSNLDLINWRGYYFGVDQVYDAILGRYVDGLKPGSVYVNEVTAGSGYVYFWFASGGPKYRTVSVVTVGSEDQLLFTFYGTTTVTTASLVASPGRAGAKAAEPHFVDIERVPDTDGAERGAEAASFGGIDPVLSRGRSTESSAEASGCVPRVKY